MRDECLPNRSCAASLKSREFTCLVIEEDEAVDAETARIARARLVGRADAARLWQNFDGFMRVAAVDAAPAALPAEAQTTLAQACGAVGLDGLRELLAATARVAASHVDRWFAERA